jgi:uncharacterized Zn finger protein
MELVHKCQMERLTGHKDLGLVGEFVVGALCTCSAGLQERCKHG